MSFDVKTLEASISQLNDALEYLREHTKDASCSKDTLLKLELALEEAIVNIMKHGYGDKAGSISMKCSLVGEKCTISLKDQGRPFDQSKHESQDGHGLKILRALIDEMKYERVNEENILTLTKLLR